MKTTAEIFKEAGLENLLDADWCMECGGCSMDQLDRLLYITRMDLLEDQQEMRRKYANKE